MRTTIFLALTLALASPALAQKRALPEFKYEQAGEEQTTRRGRIQRDVRTFGVEVVPEEPFPWGALGLAAMLGVAAIPFGLRLFRSTKKDLQDQATFGLRRGE